MTNGKTKRSQRPARTLRICNTCTDLAALGLKLALAKIGTAVISDAPFTALCIALFPAVAIARDADSRQLVTKALRALFTLATHLVVTAVVGVKPVGLKKIITKVSARPRRTSATLAGYSSPSKVAAAITTASAAITSITCPATGKLVRWGCSSGRWATAPAPGPATTANVLGEAAEPQ